MYNIGQGNFLKSPVYGQAKVNPNDHYVTTAFMKHVYANGTHDGKDNDGDGLIDEPGEYIKLPGLTKRRLDELQLYFT